MVPITAAAASGLTSPSTRRVPAPSSVAVAASALSMAGRTPIEANHRAVPAIRPPPKAWFQPCAIMVMPTIRRISSAAMLTACMPSALGGGGMGRPPGGPGAAELRCGPALLLGEEVNLEGLAYG